VRRSAKSVGAHVDQQRAPARIGRDEVQAVLGEHALRELGDPGREVDPAIVGGAVEPQIAPVAGGREPRVVGRERCVVCRELEPAMSRGSPSGSCPISAIRMRPLVENRICWLSDENPTNSIQVRALTIA
jgi:hypothetical protein